MHKLDIVHLNRGKPASYLAMHAPVVLSGRLLFNIIMVMRIQLSHVYVLTRLLIYIT